MAVDAGEQAAVAPHTDAAVHRARRGQVLRQQTPGHATAQHKEHAVDDLPQRPQPGPNLTGFAPDLAQRLLFVSLLDLLATTAPFVPMDGSIEEVVGDVVDAALGPESGELCGSALDVLRWIEPPAEESGGRYSLRLVQYLGALLDRYGDPANPPQLVGALQVLMDFLPEPSVISFAFGAEVNRISPSPIGRGDLVWSGVVTLPAGPCR